MFIQVHMMHTRLKAPKPASGLIGHIYIFTTTTPTLSAHLVTLNKQKNLHRIAEKITS
jgi:hypothetical protein